MAMHVAGMADMLAADLLTDASVGRMGDATMAQGMKSDVVEHSGRSLAGDVLECDASGFEQFAEGKR